MTEFLAHKDPGQPTRIRLAAMVLATAAFWPQGETAPPVPYPTEIIAPGGGIGITSELAIPNRSTIDENLVAILGDQRPGDGSGGSPLTTESRPSDASPSSEPPGPFLPPAPLPARSHDTSMALDRSEDFDLTGDLLPLNQAQTGIIQSLGIPDADKRQIEVLMRGAMTLWAQGIPVNAEAMVAQGILESGRQSNWTPNSLASYNNFWGMKARPDDPADQKRVFNSAEFENGSMTAPQPSTFLVFPKATDGVEGYGEFILRRWWYRDALEDPAAIDDPGVYYDNLLDDGRQWTSTPAYKSDLLQIILDLRLAEIADAM